MTNSAILADQFLRDLALAIARNQVGAMRPTHEVIAGEGVTQTEYDKISTNPQFQRYVDAYCNDLRENGFSFEAKARVLAEGSLPMLYHMAHDPDTPAAVRRQVIADLVEWGRLKPKTDAPMLTGTGFSITINLPNPAQNSEKTVVLDADIIENTAENTPENTPKRVENSEKMTKTTLLALFEEEIEVHGEDVYE